MFAPLLILIELALLCASAVPHSMTHDLQATLQVLHVLHALLRIVVEVMKLRNERRKRRSH